MSVAKQKQQLRTGVQSGQLHSARTTRLKLCPPKPVPFAGISVPPFPSLVTGTCTQLAEGETRLVKSSAYSLHCRKGHKTANSWPPAVFPVRKDPVLAMP